MAAPARPSDSRAPGSLAGQLLLAMPGIGDPRFEQAVIALCAHGPEGALGVGVGRAIPGFGLHRLLRQVGVDAGVAPDAPVHLGGPVDPERGFVLHTADWRGEDTTPVTDALALTTTLDVLRAIAAGTGPAAWAVALGYAGWAPGQLEAELGRHGWFQVPATRALALEGDGAGRWQRAFAAAGVDVRLLATTSGRA